MIMREWNVKLSIERNFGSGLIIGLRWNVYVSLKSEIGGSRLNFFAICIKHLHVSSNRNSSHVHRNQETVRVDQ